MDHSTTFSGDCSPPALRWFSNAHSLSDRTRTNNRGFVTTMALTLLPFVVAAALCALVLIWFIEQKEKVQWACESENVAAQKILTTAMNQLLALNPKIEALVLEKKWVQSLLKLPTTVDKPALLARLIVLNGQLMALSAQQKALILTAQSRAELQLIKLRQNLQQLVIQTARPWNAHLQLQYHTKRALLRLRKKKMDPLASVYLEHPGLASQQEIHVRIAIVGKRLFPMGLTWLSPIPIYWQESCKSQPQKEHSLWHAKLQADKF